MIQTGKLAAVPDALLFCEQMKERWTKRIQKIEADADLWAAEKIAQRQKKWYARLLPALKQDDLRSEYLMDTNHYALTRWLKRLENFRRVCRYAESTGSEFVHITDGLEDSFFEWVNEEPQQ